MKEKIKLILQDGSEFDGYSFGKAISTSGEVVFNTGMMGYPETMTDPSYKGQILCLTYPMVGNYGVPNGEIEDNLLKNFESANIQIQGLIIDELSEEYHHWEAKQSLHEWMEKNDIPGIYGVDTRALTKKLREKGTILGKIIVDKDVPYYDPNVENLVDQVSVKEPVTYERGPKKIIVMDCGIKNNIIRSFLKRDITVIRVPWNYDFFEHNLEFDGVFISNGPGDPKMCDKTIGIISKALEREIPTFGICLGNQLLALAAGADTYKLKYGHRSQNQPCKELGTNKCFITSQNHGFAVKEDSIPSEWEPWFVNVNDNTNEGMKHKSKPFFSVQFHPEATPGPVDTAFLFDRFIEKLG
tara:strand:- start:354 stop:1421 length:1068 start_codon:yes stop_codon:yes gene_type:complete